MANERLFIKKQRLLIADGRLLMADERQLLASQRERSFVDADQFVGSCLDKMTMAIRIDYSLYADQ